MPKETVEGIRRWLPTLIAVVTLVVHLFVVARWSARIEDRVEAVEKHAESSDSHMPLTEKIDLFITRREAEKADKELRSLLLNMEGKIDFLYQRAQKVTITE